jgi:hypothetical protein
MDKTSTHPETVRLIDELGGTGKVAEICDLTPSAISQWRSNGIPHGYFKFLRHKFPKATWAGVLVAKRSKSDRLAA